jgi:hypothetical protein
MQRLFKCLLGPAFATFASLAAAQTQQPAQSAPAQPPTLHAITQLVVVDVVVAGEDRKPVHGLKASDFTLTEQGVSQVFKHFEEHTAVTPAEATKFPSMPTLPPGIFSNYTPEPVNGAVTLLLFDALTTPAETVANLRQFEAQAQSSQPIFASNTPSMR